MTCFEQRVLRRVRYGVLGTWLAQVRARARDEYQLRVALQVCLAPKS
jgi:hypothetical protein